ncbi:hypothetical protein [Paenibacillus tepidiphilus]|uniref:hypothetical protein n=1 Tax=Paenibacillus tepidiphilus TaxID=2608683 RepID=UPI00123A0E9A|nr:hypothetical protein [Paenibacillus tepidiphilus]
MNWNEKPFKQMVRMMKEATAGGNHAKAFRDKADNCRNVSVFLREVMNQQVSPEELSHMQLYAPEYPDQGQDPLYDRIYRMMDRDLEDFARGTKAMQAFEEACALLKKGIESNTKGLFHDLNKREIAIRQMDEELARIKAQVGLLKKSKRKPAKQSVSTEGGNAGVNVTNVMKEIFELLDRLEQANEAVPDNVEDSIWDEDCEKLIAVGNREYFVLQGEERAVAFAVLETPLTRDIQLIRLGSDYWRDAEETLGFNDEAFYVESYPDLAEALAEILNAINSEDDLELGNGEGGLALHYDTRSSLSDKFSRLLSGEAG